MRQHTGGRGRCEFFFWLCDSLESGAGSCDPGGGEMQPSQGIWEGMGAVYIVQMSAEAEHLEHLREIRNAQSCACRKVLDEFQAESGKQFD